MKYTELVKYNEKKQRGHSGFPIELYRVDNRNSQYIMPLHWHDELEIIRVNSGNLNLFINNIPYCLSAGDIAIINCKYLHRAEPDNCKYDCIVCDLETMVKTNNDIYVNYIYPIVKGNLVINCLFHTDSTMLYFYLNSIFSLLSNEPERFQLSVLGNLINIIEQLYAENCISQIKMSKKHSSQANIIAELLEWIDNNYTEHINLDMLASKAGITSNYLCRIFKAYTSKTPIEYVNHIRIQNVCNEIEWGQKSITEIALDNGFNDISYFCKVFKKHTGISAKKYLSSKNNLHVK